MVSFFLPHPLLLRCVLVVFSALRSVGSGSLRVSLLLLVVVVIVVSRRIWRIGFERVGLGRGRCQNLDCGFDFSLLSLVVVSAESLWAWMVMMGPVVGGGGGGLDEDLWWWW